MSLASCQIDAMGVTAAPRSVKDGHSLHRLGRHLKDIMFGLVLSFFLAVIVSADEMPQGWVPEVITLPDDAVVMMDRAIGSSVRIFSFSTEADVKAVFGHWSVPFEENGYTIRPQQAEINETTIEFSGR